MVDRLELLSRAITGTVAKLAESEGDQTRNYRRCIDLRKTELKLPVRLYYQGCHDGIHKAEFIGVSKLGKREVKRIGCKLFGSADLREVWIYRIDFAVDVPERSIEQFLARCAMPRSQYWRIEGSRRTGMSLYIGKDHQMLIYDKAKQIRHEQRYRPKGKYGSRVPAPGDRLVRIEERFRSNLVPIREFADLDGYDGFHLLRDLTFYRLTVESDEQTDGIDLPAMGFQELVNKFGVNATLKLFPSQERARIKRRFLTAGEGAELRRLRALMQKSVQAWLEA